MSVWLKATRNYSNPDSVNYRAVHLREEMSKNLGYMSFDDLAQVALLGNTIISGGYINTELLKAKSILADHLQVDDLAAISGNFSGNVLVEGDLLVGGQGVLSVFQYISVGDAIAGDGWSDFGAYERGGTTFYGNCRVTVPVPDRFVITKATLTAEAMARYNYDEIGQVGSWSQSKNLKIYKASGDRATHTYLVPSGDGHVAWYDKSDITNAVWGVNSWSPALIPASPTTGNPPYIQRKSGDIKSYLTAGESTTFEAEADTSAPGSGTGRIIVVLEGYITP